MKRLIALLFIAALVVPMLASAQSVRITPARVGQLVSSLPPTCAVGDVVFLTTAPIGLHECKTLNTWTATGSGGGGGAITCLDTGVLFADGADSPACDAGFTYNSTAGLVTLTADPESADLLAGSWTVGAGWTGGPTGPWTHTPGSTATLTNALTTPAVPGSTYKVSIVIGDQSAGSLLVGVGDDAFPIIGADGPVTRDIIIAFPTTTTGLVLTPDTDYDGEDIEIIAVVQIPINAVVALAAPALTSGNRFRIVPQAEGDSSTNGYFSIQVSINDGASWYESLRASPNGGQLIAGSSVGFSANHAGFNGPSDFEIKSGGKVTFLDPDGLEKLMWDQGGSTWRPATTDQQSLGLSGQRWLKGWFGTDGIDSTGPVTAPYYITNGSGLSVANVGANSCGTTAATIAGGPNSFRITVGATAGTQCRVTLPVAPTEWNCTANNTTTANLARVTPVDTTNVDFLGTFVAGDVVSGVCIPR